MGLNKIKEWQLDLSETHAKIEALGKPVVYRGRVDSVEQLPENAEDGDLWYVGSVDQDNKEEYIWQNGKWELLGSTDFTNIYTKEEIDNKVIVIEADIDANADAILKTRGDFMESDSELQQQINAHATAIAGKQDKLTAGENITIEGNVISATGGGELPDNVYTKDNLVAGENITFSEVLPEGGIDEHTLACWHFDESTTDSVNNFSLNAIGSLDNSYIKFGDASCQFTSVYAGNDISQLGINPTKTSITADFWVKAVGSNATPRVGFGSYKSSVLVLYISQNSVTLGGPVWSDTSIDLGIVPGGEFNHYALQYDKDKKTVALFFNGKKIVEQNIAIELEATSFNDFVTYCYYQARIDELRISDCIRYAEDFTPPTEPYTLATGPTKKAINAVIPPVELPSDLYRQSNLLGGKDIEIVPEPVEGGIDEHTVACWHFDTDNVDVVNGISLGSSVETSFFKFAPGCSLGNGYQTSINLPFSFGSTQDFSFDLWYLRYASNGDGEIGFKDGKGYYHTMWFYINYLGQVQCRHNGTLSEVVATIPQGKWAHLYAHHKAETNTYEYFIDGKKVYSAVDETLFGDRKQFSIASYYTAYKDEVRISDIARYDGDFTPPTQPYRLAEPTGNMVINFTGKAGEAGGNGKNIGEVYYSQSSLASDNAGALPLFTGETIASADTIYPDFYSWVESHTELQTTAEDYETALSTYGECPKYVVSDGSLRLPKLANYIKMANAAEGITQSEAGLPNITGVSGHSYNDYGGEIREGAFYPNAEPLSGLNVAGGTSGGTFRTLGFDASLSSEMYGKSDTVTPAHTTLYPWVFAFNASVAASTAQAAEFQQGLSGKADADLDNTIPSKTFRENVFNWGLPDYTAGVSKTWNTDITAETNGWVRLTARLNDDAASLEMTINGTNVFHWWYTYDAQGNVSQTIPVGKGDVYKVWGATASQTITFYPCKGETL